MEEKPKREDDERAGIDGSNGIESLSQPNLNKDSNNGQEKPAQAASLNREADFKNLRALMMIAGVGGPFSFILGGVLLSTVALVCAIVSFIIYKRLYSGSQGLANSARIKHAVIFSIVISAAALVWNVVWLVMVMPEVLQMIQSNDFSSLYNGGSTSSPAPDGGKTIWD